MVDFDVNYNITIMKLRLRDSWRFSSAGFSGSLLLVGCGAVLSANRDGGTDASTSLPRLEQSRIQFETRAGCDTLIGQAVQDLEVDPIRSGAKIS